MTYVSCDCLFRAASALMREIDRAVDTVSGSNNPDDQASISANIVTLERCAKAISLCLKTIGDIEVHNQKVAAHSESETYTSYEDLPPPNPVERQRVIERVLALAARIETGSRFPQTGGASPRQ